MRLIPLVFGLGCSAGGGGPDPGPGHGGDGGDGGAADSGHGTDSGGPPDPPDCPAPDFVLVGHWDKPELPNRASTDHTDPGVALGDLDGDGDLDALVGYGGGSFVMLNPGDGVLVMDQPWTIDGQPLPPASAVALADLDQDGDLDAWLGIEWDGIDVLALQQGPGDFRAVELAGSEGAPETISLADADGDGDLDAFVAQMESDVHPEQVLNGSQVGDPNLFYRQGAPGSFALDEAALPQDTNMGISFEGAWLDADGDGDLDIYEGNAWGGVLVPNQLLLNDGSGRFSVDHDCGCALQINSMGVGVGDANHDGLPDLHISDIGTPRLLGNLGDGSFADVTYAWGADLEPDATHLSSWATTFSDFDRDGCNDLLVSFGGLGSEAQAELDYVTPEGEDWQDPEAQADQIMLGDCRGGFRAVETSLDAAADRKNRAVATGDLNGDGLQDFVSAGKHYVRVWLGTGGCAGGLVVALDGGGANPDALGATVAVTVDGRTQTQWMLTSVTHGNNAPQLAFGLGHAGAADRVQITWPDGSQAEVRDVAAGTVRIQR